ncbi:MAG: XRE family transcriptional regulator [Verrucomicrobia bacterium]|nr:XRE family transcriptional regulator [Verrucomicrobiota bacterium]
MLRDNIFADLDLANSEELLARSELLSEISERIKSSKLSQKEIARILNITQPKVSMLVSGKLSAFSADTLLHYLTLLGCNVEIHIKSSRRVSRATSRGKMMVRRKTTPSRHFRRRLARR